MYHQVASTLHALRASAVLRWGSRIPHTIDGWARAELAPWAFPLTQGEPARLEQDILALNASEPWVYCYRIGSGGTELLGKPQAILDKLDPVAASSAAKRAGLYLAFLSAAAAGLRAKPFLIAVNVNDVPFQAAGVPVFSFQKDDGTPVILLPDVDLLNDKYVLPSWLSLDRVPFRRKAASAVFVGSTTGDRIIDAETVRTLSLPRLRAAMHFRDSPGVRFLLPNIIQCDSPGTEAALRALLPPARPMSWQEQFRHRFIISIDGNGATCSRVVVALKSRAALMKYDSPRVLYYFQGLTAGTHYVPIHTDADVEAAVADSQTDAARYAAIARAGRHFYRDYLGQTAVRFYMTRLLATYAGLREGVVEPSGVEPLTS